VASAFAFASVIAVVAAIVGYGGGGLTGAWRGKGESAFFWRKDRGYHFFQPGERKYWPKGWWPPLNSDLRPTMVAAASVSSNSKRFFMLLIIRGCGMFYIHTAVKRGREKS
jgi:hypothetical protein